MSSEPAKVEPAPAPANDVSRARVASLKRLGGLRDRIPLVTQVSAADCGPACLAMVLAHFGKPTPLPAVAATVSAHGGAGINARQLVEAARSYGLRARGVKLAVEQLKFLPPASILHWEMNHFVVLESTDRRGARVLDPASGPRHVSWKDLGDKCTGIAVLCEPTPDFAAARQGAADRPRSRFARYSRWLKVAPGYWPRVIGLSAILQLAALSMPLAVGLTIDKIVPRQDGELLQLLAAGALIVLSVQLLTNYVRSQLLLHLRTYMDAHMTMELNEHVLALPFEFFQKRSTGDLTLRLASSAQIREVLTSAALSGVLDGGLALAYLVLLIVLAPPLAAIAVGVALVQAVIVLSSGRRNAELMSEQLVAQAKLSNAQVETLAAIEPVKSMGAERRIGERWADLYVDVLNAGLDRGRLGARVGTLTGALGFAGPVALLLTGAHLVLQGDLGTGSMLALTSVGAAFLTPVGALVNMWTQLQTLRSYFERLEDILDTKTEPRLEATEKRLEGAIDLREVSFAYDPRGPNVLDRVSLSVRPGEFVAIVGPSGSGKSTLARLLSALYAPVSGQITFEGRDARHWDPTTLRSSLGMVTQDTRLFASSVRDNITLFDPTVPLERVQRAAELAEIHADIARLPMAYDTVLSDGGGSVSGGQRQRVSLARALLREPGVLILDEATSHLDTISERRVHDNLAALRCTRIVIAHRLSSVRSADRIVVLEAGRVVDAGPHAELMVRCGVYRALVGAQGEG